MNHLQEELLKRIGISEDHANYPYLMKVFRNGFEAGKVYQNKELEAVKGDVRHFKAKSECLKSAVDIHVRRVKKVEKELEAVKARGLTYAKKAGKYLGELCNEKEKNLRLEKELEAVKEWLKDSEHKIYCLWRTSNFTIKDCTCGLDELLKGGN